MPEDVDFCPSDVPMLIVGRMLLVISFFSDFTVVGRPVINFKENLCQKRVIISVSLTVKVLK